MLDELPSNEAPYLSMISLPRVVFIEETEATLTVELNGERYAISKSTEASFITQSSSSRGMQISTRQIQSLELPRISTDASAHPAFMEVMIFHEIREMQYEDADFEDAHDRAVHDEILYVLKYLDQDTQNRYFEFARNERREAKLEMEREATRRQKEQEEEGAKAEKEHQEWLEERRIEAEQARTQNEIKRALTEERRSREDSKFWAEHPELDAYVTEHERIWTQELDGKKFSNFFKNYNGTPPLHFVNKNKMRTREKVEQLIKELLEEIKHKYKYGPKRIEHLGRQSNFDPYKCPIIFTDRLDNCHQERTSFDRNKTKDYVHTSLDEDIKINSIINSLNNKTIVITPAERQWLQDLVDLYQEVAQKEAEGAITPEFLREVLIKANVLYNGKRSRPCYFDEP